MVLLQLHFGFSLVTFLGHLVLEKAQVCFAALFAHISIWVCFSSSNMWLRATMYKESDFDFFENVLKRLSFQSCVSSATGEPELNGPIGSADWTRAGPAWAGVRWCGRQPA